MYLLVRLFIYLLPSGIIRTKWIERFHIFRKSGENFYFCPRKLPADPQLIEFGDNVAIATDVMFINHDVSQKVYNNVKEEKLPKYFGCIRMGNNVFIGSKTVILPNIYVCDEVFIAAGAVVSSSILEPGVYGGIPAKKIGDMDELYRRRIKEYKPLVEGKTEDEILTALWNYFDEGLGKNEKEDCVD